MKRGPSLNKARHSHGCSRIREHSIIVAGGAKNGPLISTEILRIEDLKWTIGTDLEEGVYLNKVIKSNVNDYIAYSIGGRTKHRVSSNIYGLNGNKNQWQLLGNMNEPRWHGSAVNAPSTLIPWCKI